MKRYPLALPLLLAATTLLAVTARPAHAELRPVGLASASLQTYFDGVSENITALVDQYPGGQRWACTVSGNSAVTLMLELAGDANGNVIGVYDAGLAVTNHYPVFLGNAGVGSFAVASFRTGPDRLIVNRFDANAFPQGSQTYMGVTLNDFGYYIENTNAGRGYSQDAYRATGRNVGNWWLCFEDADPDDPDANRDFDDAVLFVESINPTAVSKTSWGALKSRFR